MQPQSIRAVAAAVAALCLAGPAPAQNNVKPPKAQLWMDLSTGSMAGMPEMEGAGMGGLLGGLMGSAMGGGARGGAAPYYGLARGLSVMPARVLDIALYNRLKPGQEASQAIPAGLQLGDSLPLLPPKPQAQAPREHEPGEPSQDVERPRGRILVYWGCGTSVRPGQPRVIDLARGNPADFGAAFAGRYAPDRGVRVGPGHALYPNERTTANVPRGASVQGTHRVTGDGLPPGFEFNLGPAQDLLPAIELRSSGALQGSVALGWGVVAQARAYYLHAMGSVGEDLVMWSSAETGDTGMGLFDYLPNATIDRWLKERVLLAPDTTQCAVPSGIFQGSQGAMARMVAYGSETHLAHPPRPADPKAAWEPDWAVRVRTKAHTMALLGEDMGGRGGARRGAPMAAPADASGSPSAPPADSSVPNPVNLLRGLFGR